MRNIPLIDLSYQWKSLRKETMAAIEQVLDRGQYILGPQSGLLEEEVAARSGQKHGIGVANGTDALVLALAACGVGRGDEVITTPFTFFATVESILLLGATPVFADVDKQTFNISASSVEKAITPRTKAILPVHLYGQMADMPALRALADRYSLRVIEDACQAIGATWQGQGIGHWGDAATLSFYPTKNLGAYGDAGMILTSDDALADKLRILRVHGSKQRYHHDTVGWNSRLDEIQAAILRVKLTRFDEWTAHRIALAERYNAAFAHLDLQLPLAAPHAGHVYHLYTVVTDQRDALKSHLQAHGISSDVYYPIPMHLQKAMQPYGFQKGDFPVAERLAEQCLSLPLYPGMVQEDQDRVIDAVQQYFKK
ncbi:MAG: DegT/DnrJ/EryC1/StrS family aminotransferase [Tumebacillaceae bacterium]